VYIHYIIENFNIIELVYHTDNINTNEPFHF